MTRRRCQSTQRLLARPQKTYSVIAGSSFGAPSALLNSKQRGNVSEFVSALSLASAKCPTKSFLPKRKNLSLRTKRTFTNGAALTPYWAAKRLEAENV